MGENPIITSKPGIQNTHSVLERASDFCGNNAERKEKNRKKEANNTVVVKICDVECRFQIAGVWQRFHATLQEGLHGQLFELRFRQIFGGAKRFLSLSDGGSRERKGVTSRDS